MRDERASLFADVLRDCRDAAALHVSRCKSESQFDSIPYYEGRRDAFDEVLTHFEEHGTGYVQERPPWHVRLRVYAAKSEPWWT